MRSWELNIDMPAAFTVPSESVSACYSEVHSLTCQYRLRNVSEWNKHCVL